MNDPVVLFVIGELVGFYAGLLLHAMVVGDSNERNKVDKE